VNVDLCKLVDEVEVPVNRTTGKAPTTFATIVGCWEDVVCERVFPFPDLSLHSLTVVVPVSVDESAASNHKTHPGIDVGIE